MNSKGNRMFAVHNGIWGQEANVQIINCYMTHEVGHWFRKCVKTFIYMRSVVTQSDLIDLIESSLIAERKKTLQSAFKVFPFESNESQSKTKSVFFLAIEPLQ